MEVLFIRQRVEQRDRTDDGRGYIWADKDRFSYDTESNTFHLALLPTIPLVPGFEYTVALEDGSGVDWHDPYGIRAWDSQWDAYSFEYIHQPSSP